MTATTETNTAAPAISQGDTVRYDGHTWKVLGVGATQPGKTYYHLASTTRFVEQRNGKRAKQMAAWLWNENVTKVQS